MAVSVVMMLDEDGEFHELARYTLEPKQALIAYYMQHEKKNFKTYEYPDDLDVIQERSFGRGYQYWKGDAVIYSKWLEDATA